MQASSKTIHHDDNPENRKPYTFRIQSEALGRTVYVTELATIHVDDLRTLYHEVYCDRQSMFKAINEFTVELQRAAHASSQDGEHIESKLNQLSRKINVYNSFYKLIKREVTWRVSLHNVAKAKIVIQAKQVGLTDAQINALLDPDNCIHKLFTINSYPSSTTKRKEITVADRLESMRNEMFMAEFCSILSKEFDPPELAEIRQEAMSNVEKAVDWKQIESMLNEHLPDDNGVLQL
jgi:hypothetical protein